MALLATDGTYEGIIKGLETRSNRASLFYKDEFSGFLSGVLKKDYMSGLTESMILLYDGDKVVRKLAKGNLTITDPVFIIYGGGIRERILESMTIDHVYSGFIPRFMFIVGKADYAKLRPIGPAVVENTEQQELLTKRFREIYHFFDSPTGKRKLHTIIATQEAWNLYNTYHGKLLNTAINSAKEGPAQGSVRSVAMSGLKMAGLLAAANFSTIIGVQE